MKNKICKISLFSAILACITNMPADAVVKTKNSSRSYANAYNQVTAMQQQQAYYDATATNATTASAAANLPVMVDDKNLAESIANNTAENVNISDLETCSMIYPNGVFKWSIPESGIRMNQTQQCVAVVELRDANTNAVLATTTLASGDSMKCNIDMFPVSGRFAALEKVEVPSDNPPTMDDVKRVMNEEQKQNAGLKIAAAAIISGIAGNMLAPKNAGDTKLMGTSNTQLMDTAIGVAAGAGVMAASTYSGKVAGDTIKSTAVNAAAGMLVGNMSAGMSGGDSVIDIKKCTIGEEKTERDCIVGSLVKKGAPIEYSTDAGAEVYIINNKGETLKCKRKSATDTTTADLKDCTPVNQPLHIKLVGISGDVDYDKLVGLRDGSGNKKDDYTIYDIAERFVPDETNPKNFRKTDSPTGVYFAIQTAEKIDSFVRAYAVYERINKKAFGYTLDDYNNDLSKNSYSVHSRNADGSAGRCIAKCPVTREETDEQAERREEKEKQYEFRPSLKGAEDGGLIDINNEARAKATLIGTAAGGALGGFAGYKGAQSELEQRWVEEVRAYNDSLSNFVCMTGGRFLSKYNDYVEIPEIKKTEQ